MLKIQLGVRSLGVLSLDNQYRVKWKRKRCKLVSLFKQSRCLDINISIFVSVGVVYGYRYIDVKMVIVIDTDRCIYIFIYLHKHISSRQGQ